MKPRYRVTLTRARTPGTRDFENEADQCETVPFTHVALLLCDTEIELSALNGQCLERRIPDLETLRNYIATWENDRNNRQSKINWRFSTADARIKLKHLYQKL